jgi:hypothetical protein
MMGFAGLISIVVGFLVLRGADNDAPAVIFIYGGAALVGLGLLSGLLRG